MGDLLTGNSIEACGNLAEAMRHVREHNGYTEEKMAEVVGCSRNMIKSYELNKVKIPVYVVMKYSEELNVPITSLIYYKREEPKRKLEAKIRTDLKTLPDEQLKAIDAVIETYKSAAIQNNNHQ